MRTLHHYDEIGLLRPATRSDSGRRLYDADSLLRLQQILLHRALGFALEEIQSLLDDPAFDRRAALVRQRRAVTSRIAEHEALLRGIDRALSLIDGHQQKDMDMKDLFDGFDPKQYDAEAETRWGETDQWTAATRRTATYTEDDWARFNSENRAICEALAHLMVQGTPPDAPETQQQVEAYRAMTSNWFYYCDRQQIGNLATLYSGDKRFRDSFDRYADGLSVFVIAAFHAFADME